MSAFVPAAAVAAVVHAFVPPNIGAGIALLVAAIGLTLLDRKPLQRTGGTLLVCAVGLAIGIGCSVSGEISVQQGPAIVSSRVQRLSGVTRGHAERDETGWTVTVAADETGAEHISVTANLLVVLAGHGPVTPAPGSPVDAEINGLSAGRDGTWYANAVHVEIGDPPAIGRLRANVFDALSGAIDSAAGTGAPLLSALILGVDSDLSARTRDLFRRAGISHVLALSGMHLAVVAALVVALTRPLFGVRPALVAGAVAALVYTLLIGARPSLVRATLMCEIALVLSLLERPLHLVEIVATAFLIHCIVQPLAIDTLSFRLSYLALLGISVVSPLVIREIKPWIPPLIAAPLAAGAGAQIAGAPLLLAVFGSVYPVGVVAGAVVGPIVAVFMTVGIFGIALSGVPVPLVAGISPWVLSALDRVVESIAWWFSGSRGIGSSQVAVPVAAISLACLVGGYLTERRRVLWTGRE